MVKQIISLSLFVCNTLIHAMDKEKALQPLAPHRAQHNLCSHTSAIYRFLKQPRHWNKNSLKQLPALINRPLLKL